MPTKRLANGDVRSVKRTRYNTNAEAERAREFRLLVETDHAISMQRYRTHKLATDAVNYGMTCTIAKTISFAEVCKRLDDPSMVRVMKLILHRICVLTAKGVRDCPGSEKTKNVRTKVFLASFKIAFHPTDVFENMTKREVELKDAAFQLLRVFDTLCLDIVGSKRGTCLQEMTTNALNFPGVLHRYLEAFETWKLWDEARLTDRITHALTALYEADGHLVATDPDTPRMRTEFRAQIERLRFKLMQIAGTTTLKRIDELHTMTPIAIPVNVPVKSDNPATTLGGYSALPRRMTNEQISYELLMDPSFTLDEHGSSRDESNVYSKIRRTFHVRLSKPRKMKILKTLSL
jgi:hypothetical protein